MICPIIMIKNLLYINNIPKEIKEYEYFPYIYDGPEFYFKIRNNSIKYIGAEFYK